MLIYCALNSLAERLHRVGKTRCDSWGWWVEKKKKKKREQGVGERVESNHNVITAQFCSSLSHLNEYCQEDWNSRPPSALAPWSAFNRMHSSSSHCRKPALFYPASIYPALWTVYSFCTNPLWKSHVLLPLSHFGAMYTSGIYCRISLKD